MLVARDARRRVCRVCRESFLEPGQLGGDPRGRPADRGTIQCRPRRDRRPLDEDRRRGGPTGRLPCPRSAARRARGPREPGSARSPGRPARTRRRSRPRAKAGPVRSGCMAIPRRVLMRLTASAPCCSAAAATSAGDAQLGVSLTINGFSEIGRTTSSSPASSRGSAPMTSPVLTFGHETLSSIADDLVALGEGGDQAGDVLARRAHDVDDQRHRQLGELRQVLVEVAVEALVGQPDRVDHAAGQLPQPRRRVALARLERDGLGDEGGEREAARSRASPKALRAAMASNVPEPLTIRCASGMPQNSITARPGR